MLLYAFISPDGSSLTMFQIQLCLQSLGFSPEFDLDRNYTVALSDGSYLSPYSNVSDRFGVSYRTPIVLRDANGTCFLWHEEKFAMLRYDPVQVAQTADGTVRVPRALALGLKQQEALTQALDVPALEERLRAMQELNEQMLRALLCQKLPEALLQQLAASADRLGIRVPFDDVEDSICER